MNVCISTMDNNMLYDIGVEYLSNVDVETNLMEYNPYFTESPTDTNEMELNLLLYNPNTLEALPIDEYNMEEIYDWLITDEFAPFISDDNEEIIYYFKVVRLSKVLTFGKKGYLRVVFKPYSKYCYKRKEYKISVNGREVLEIYNESKMLYKPIMKITNFGSEIAVNSINDMKIINLQDKETIIIDNHTKLIQTEDGINKFNCCNAKWIQLNPREYTTLTLDGIFEITIICEFPILY